MYRTGGSACETVAVVISAVFQSAVKSPHHCSTSTAVHSTPAGNPVQHPCKTVIILLPARRRPQGLVVIGVCLSVCLSVRTVFVRKISQEPVHGTPPNLVGGSRG